MERMFPVLARQHESRGTVFVPWALVAPHAAQAEKNHHQTLERLAERGGLAPCELAAVLEDRAWRRMHAPEAWLAIFRHAKEQAWQS